MSEAPDTHELGRRVSRLDDLFDEIQTVVKGILHWKDKITGGITVMMWGVGIIQSIVLVCIGLAANSLNNTATILGTHAVELATARTKIDTFMAASPRPISEAEIRAWVRDEAHEQSKQ